MHEIEGFPYREVQLRKDGRIHDDAEVDNVIESIFGGGTTDLLVFAHGWKNDLNDARGIYRQLARRLREQIDGGFDIGNRKLAILGWLWPAKKFTDPELIVGGGASADDDDMKELFADLEDFFDAADADAKLAQLHQLLNQEDPDFAVVADLIGHLVEPDDIGDDLALELSPEFFSDSAEEVLDTLSKPTLGDVLGNAPGDDEVGGGQAGLFGDLLGGIRSGARKFLNATTYYQMKKRAGVVGSRGGLDILKRIRQIHPQLRLHLVGHSFGGRVVAAAATGPNGVSDLEIDSLSLLQAAFSHHGLGRTKDGKEGFFRPVVAQQRVRGPILITHTKNDQAVQLPYAIASRLTGQDAAAVGDAEDSYGAIGSNGAQGTPEVDVDNKLLLDPGGIYAFAAHKPHNLLADAHIPSHNEVAQPAVANVILQAVLQS